MARRIETLEYGRETAVEEPRIHGVWQRSSNGWVLEISVPLHTIYLAETDDLVRLLAQDLGEWRHEAGRSVNTIAVHRANIMNTLGVHKTAELVVYALQHGLVNPL